MNMPNFATLFQIPPYTPSNNDTLYIVNIVLTHVRTQVMLESFLQAQKVSVRKTLQRSFRRYVTYGEENNQLIMHQLQNLIMEVEKYKMVRTSILMK